MKRYFISVFCPKCRTRRRVRMPMLRLFGTQRCRACGHCWVPPRMDREQAEAKR